MLDKIPTGCRVIDKALGGGILSGSVSLIYGEAETGKTTLAIQCAANCARQGYKTLFIDCDGMFSPNRLSQITMNKFEEIAELVILMRPNNFREQTLIIDQLTDYVNEKLGLVVADTITSLYRLKVAESPDKTFELNRELNRQLASLAQIARTQKVAILMVSQVRTAFKEDHVSIEPVATRVLKFWADTIINMNLTENPQIVKTIIEKTSMKAQPISCFLKIDESGIHEYIAH
jgi:DNA repair protein RadB